MANTDKEKSEEVVEENASKQNETQDTKSISETDKERSFKEGLANNSDTDKKTAEKIIASFLC